MTVITKSLNLNCRNFFLHYVLFLWTKLAEECIVESLTWSRTCDLTKLTVTAENWPREIRFLSYLTALKIVHCRKWVNMLPIQYVANVWVRRVKSFHIWLIPMDLSVWRDCVKPIGKPLGWEWVFSQKKVDGTTFGDFTTFPNPADHFRSVKGTARNDFGKKIYSKLIILCNIKGMMANF